MKDYRKLSDWDKARVDKKIVDNVEPKHHKNEHNGFEWDEPEYTLNSVHDGTNCAECWMIYYNCLCSHD